LLKVAFSQPDEFLDELRARPPDVEPVVRITGLWRSTAHYPLQHLYVVATYLRAAGGTPRVVELRHYLGQVFAGDPGGHGDPGNARVRAERMRQELAREVERLGLTVAGGEYTEGPDAP
jgi:hypothetical protein